MRDYELMLIAQPELDDAGVNAIVAQVADLLKRGGGEITFSGQLADRKGNLNAVADAGWRARTLAYAIGGKRRGYYMVLRLHTPQTALPEVERALKLNENVLRYVLLQRDEAPVAEAAAGR